MLAAILCNLPFTPPPIPAQVTASGPRRFVVGRDAARAAKILADDYDALLIVRTIVLSGLLDE